MVQKILNIINGLHPLIGLIYFEKRVKAPHVPKPDKDHYEKYDEKPMTHSPTELYPAEFDSFLIQTNLLFFFKCI